MSLGGPPNFCSQCGASLDPGDAFCSQCGTEIGDSPTANRTPRDRITTGDTRDRDRDRDRRTGGRTATGNYRSDADRAFRRRVEDLTIAGWEIQHDYGDRVVLVNREFGRMWVHALLLFTTYGVGNALYAWYNYSTAADRAEVRADGTERLLSGDIDDHEHESEWDGADIALFVLGGLSLFFGVVSLLNASAFLGLFLVVLGALALPPVREYLAEADRESVTTFGRTRTVEERRVTVPDEDCAVCDRAIGDGVKRTYHDRDYVAGFPVRTHDEGENYYCRACENDRSADTRMRREPEMQ